MSSRIQSSDMLEASAISQPCVAVGLLRPNLELNQTFLWSERCRISGLRSVVRAAGTAQWTDETISVAAEREEPTGDGDAPPNDQINLDGRRGKSSQGWVTQGGGVKCQGGPACFSLLF